MNTSGKITGSVNGDARDKAGGKSKGKENLPYHKKGQSRDKAGKAARLFGVSWSLVDRGTDPLMPKAKERQKRKPDNSVVENLPQQNSVCLWKIFHRQTPTTTGQTHKQSRPAAFLGANGATFFKFGERQPTRSGSRKRRNRAGVIDA